MTRVENGSNKSGEGDEKVQADKRLSVGRSVAGSGGSEGVMWSKVADSGVPTVALTIHTTSASASAYIRFIQTCPPCTPLT